MRHCLMRSQQRDLSSVSIRFRMITKLFTDDHRTGQSYVGGGPVNVYDNIHTYRSVPVSNPHALSHMTLPNNKVKLLRNPTEPLKTGSILIHINTFLLEIADNMRKHTGLRGR